MKHQRHTKRFAGVNESIESQAKRVLFYDMPYGLKSQDGASKPYFRATKGEVNDRINSSINIGGNNERWYASGGGVCCCVRASSSSIHRPARMRRARRAGWDLKNLGVFV